MAERVLVSLLFSAASVLLWLAYFAIVRDETALLFGAPGTVAAAGVAALATPRLIAAAEEADESSHGIAAGFWVTLAAYPIGVLLLAVYVAVPLSEIGTEGWIDLFSGIAWLLGGGITVGIIFLFPALFTGMAAGWLFFAIHRARTEHSRSVD